MEPSSGMSAELQGVTSPRRAFSWRLIVGSSPGRTSSHRANPGAIKPVQRQEGRGREVVGGSEKGLDVHLSERQLRQKPSQFVAGVSLGPEAFDVMPKGPGKGLPRFSAQKSMLDPLAKGIDGVPIVQHDFYLASGP